MIKSHTAMHVEIYPPDRPDDKTLGLMPSIANALQRPTLDQALAGIFDAALCGDLQADIARHRDAGAEVTIKLTMMSSVPKFKHLPKSEGHHFSKLGFEISRSGNPHKDYLYAHFGDWDTVPELMRKGIMFNTREFGDTDAFVKIGEALRGNYNSDGTLKTRKRKSAKPC